MRENSVTLQVLNPQLHQSLQDIFPLSAVAGTRLKRKLQLYMFFLRGHSWCVSLPPCLNSLCIACYTDRSALNQSFLFSLNCLNLASRPQTIGLGTTDSGTPQETALVIILLASFTTASCPLADQKLRALTCLIGPHMLKKGVCSQRVMKNTHANK